ncbi:MAG: dihydrolipoamide acetyltransferase family protein [Chloroherpetonaceae bacterium]|nr:dihydrolipoamide acetyltransferase family protein [Chloroherpetonaceae bacterium]
MAKIDVVMPKMGESIMEGTILKWRKQPGEKVQKDENILDISTDKVDAEVPATEAGILVETLFKEGDVVAVGKVIARIETDAANAVVASPESAPPSPAKSESAPAPKSVPEVSVTKPAVSQDELATSSSDRFYSPVVLNIARTEGISMAELETLAGTGQGGRVTKTDVLNYVKNRGSKPAPQVQAAPKSESLPKHSSAPVVYDASRSTVVPMDNMRKLIAEHMVRSKQTSAHVTSVSEADVTGLVKLVKSKKAAFEAANGVKLTFTPFFVEAVVNSLKEYPMLNASVDGDKIIIKKYINVGVAVALGEKGDGGLIVPVVKNADEKNLVGIARSVQDLAARARTKKLLPDDIQGGTFTLTNYGTAGNLFGAPIINQPQVAILGTGAIVKRPVVKTLEDGSDTIVIRSMMYLSLSYDHRIVDGALAGFFLQTLTNHLESYNEKSSI